jgi:mRNA-degrading endonuclease RelE of RelBE toxin-antitoxin system
MDPGGGGLDIKRLRTGEDSWFRLRVGDWRAVYRLQPASVDVLRVFHRSEGYEWIER